MNDSDLKFLQSIYNNVILEKFFKKYEILNLENFLKNKNYLKNLSIEMEKIEEIAFSYFEKQDNFDLYDDMIQPNFTGFGIFEKDSGKIVSYIYGFDARDQLDEFEYHENLIADTDLKVDPKTFKHILKKLSPQNCFYISNFASNKSQDYSFYFLQLFKKFFLRLKEKGFNFLIFRGLKDSQKFFIDEKTKKIKEKNLNYLNLKLVANHYNRFENSTTTLLQF